MKMTTNHVPHPGLARRCPGEALKTLPSELVMRPIKPCNDVDTVFLARLLEGLERW